MAFVIDASMAAAWLLPEEYSDAAEAVIATINAPCPVPSLFWFEIRNILAMAERRGRIGGGGALVYMERVRRLPLDDAGIGGDSLVLLLAANHALSAYDAAYLALALNRNVPLATLDRKLAAAARKEGITVLGPFAHGD
ncbi:PilT protein domain protein (plasmid) [Pseudorhizobium banfieldiae]|uniref:Ribonuclease VapC n=1 Tax=Pseudorhizobium banfieldiae TaxID=1125847 RepID=L0NMP7_9HYPH|nr:type II toxin-antitoxin system VapC family toxin [Pseudorhizobium banfieldiae]CAD6628575.1 PIN domain-containing protein [arsenite-oxidising bacterium NT-25]CAD6630627.1 PIN domain-containing protein [arsenite-oxidising bacterium NT-25]CCF22373.1 PilT protein domain protein [Pseudorhizobium banfieldiae]